MAKFNKSKSNFVSRKQIRKETRKQKKVFKAINYAKQKNTKKVSVSQNAIKKMSNDMKSKLKTQDFRPILKDIEFSGYNKKNNANKLNLKFKKNMPKSIIKPPIVMKDSFKMSNSVSQRMLKLQEFVNQESQKGANSLGIQKNTIEPDNSVKLKIEDNLIKDKRKLEELQKGIKSDVDEYNMLCKQLKVQKRKNESLKLFDDFDDILQDIENGVMPSNYNEVNKGYTSDEEFYNDFHQSRYSDDKLTSTKSKCFNEIDDFCSENDTESDFDELDNNLNYSNSINFSKTDFKMNSDQKKSMKTNVITHDGMLNVGQLDFGKYGIIHEDNINYEKEDDDLNSVSNITKKFNRESKSKFSLVNSSKSKILLDSDYSSLSDNSDDMNVPLPECSFSPKLNLGKITPKKRVESKFVTDNQNDSISKPMNDESYSEDGDTFFCIDSSNLLDEKKSSTNSSLKSTLKSCIQATGDQSDSQLKKRVSFKLEDTKANSNEPNYEEQYHEDIYGRLRDKSGNIVKEVRSITSVKYIPPARQKLMELNSSEKNREHLSTLKRNLKGLLNRLSESNMLGILSQFEGTYKKQSTNDVNDLFTQLLFESLVSPTLTPERFIQEHALFVAVLSANVGLEVGAYILTEFTLSFVEKFEKMECEGLHSSSKVLDNLLLFICYLYNFRVMDALLIYDVLHKISSSDFKEKQVDLILHALRSVGFTLRKSDPLALKTLISEIQSKASDKFTEDDQSFTRIRFMLDVLIAIRNNNVNKVPNFDPSNSEHLKTVMKGLVRKGCKSPHLKVTLSDIVQSKLAGKWWIVGSAFCKEQKESTSDSTFRTSKSSPAATQSIDYSNVFREKAKKLHMNRYPRINILYAITDGAFDYEDAVEKLLDLKLPQNLEKEIFDVIIYILLRCKVWTEFYPNLVLKLCKIRKDYVRLLRFALTDKFSELESMKNNHITNLANFLSQIIVDNIVDLTVIHSINFLDAKGNVIRFLRQLFMRILLNPSGVYTISQVFSLLCKNQKNNALRQYVRLFIIKFISPKTKNKNKEMATLKSRVKLCLDLLSSSGGVKL